MANIKSQEKRNRQTETRSLRNKAIRSKMKTAIKGVEAAAAAGEPTDDLIRIAQSRIDSAVAKGVLHPNNAARKKKRLASQVSSES